MTQAITGREVLNGNDEIFAFTLASALLRWRRLLIVLVVIFAAIGAAVGLLSPRRFSSSATIIPQTAESAPSGLAAAASQFGLRLPSTGNTWGAPVYIELLHSRALLMPLALDTFPVPELGNRRIPLAELLKVRAPDAAVRAEYGARAVEALISVLDYKPVGGIKLTVSSPWPSVSLALADSLIAGMNRFNQLTRKSQATAERQFVDGQVTAAEQALRESENRLLDFLQRNRAGITGSPELSFERDRLQRDVSLKTSVYTTLLQSREEARMREVRDTPVFTVLEAPRLAVVGESRGTVQKTLLGAVVGAVLAALIALVTEALRAARRSPTPESREFFRLVDSAAPRFLRRPASH